MLRVFTNAPLDVAMHNFVINYLTTFKPFILAMFGTINVTRLNIILKYFYFSYHLTNTFDIP